MFLFEVDYPQLELGFFCLLKSSFVTFREEVLKTLLLMPSFYD